MKIVVTLVVKPDDIAVLDPAQSAVIDALAAEGASRTGRSALSEVAVDLFFDCPEAGRAAECVERALAGHPVDAACQPGGRRDKRLFLADMDSTMIEIECVDELARLAGCVDEVAAITEAAMAGKLAFEDSLKKRVALLEGLAESALQAVYTDRVTVSPGARTLIATLKERGIPTVLVSGGFTYFTGRVAEDLGFTHHRANTLEIVDGRLTGRLLPPILGAAAKEQALAEFSHHYGLDQDQAVGVGDGANDVAMLTAAGLAVSYRGKEPAEAVADMRLRHTDLTSVLYALGIPQSAFAAG